MLTLPLACSASRLSAVSGYARYVKLGAKSITTNVEVWVKKVSSEPIGQRYKATEAIFIYVAVNKEGKPRAIPQID